MEEMEFNSIELCYYGQINSEVDQELRELMNDYLGGLKDLEFNWYFSEATLNAPHHRLNGWDLSRPLSYYELVDLHTILLDQYEGNVFIIRT